MPNCCDVSDQLRIYTHHELDVLFLAPFEVSFGVVLKHERATRGLAASPHGDDATHSTVFNCSVSRNLKLRFFGNPHLYTPGVTAAKFSGGTRSSSTAGTAGGGK